MFAVVAIGIHAAEHRGVVTFGELTIPGATVTATQGDQKATAITNTQGVYSFPDLSEGAWALSVEMTGFAPMKRIVNVAPGGPGAKWDLQILQFDQIKAQIQSAVTVPKPAMATPVDPKLEIRPLPLSDTFTNLSADELTQRASDGFLINGSERNAAASPFSQSSAFGNNRRSGNPLYTGNLGVILGNAAFDARPFSLTGQDTPKPDYNRFTGMASFGGPLRIPQLLRNGPNLTVNYQWTRNRNAATQSALMPTLVERGGDFSQLAVPVVDPTSGHPFPGNIVPTNRISDQAKALLALYPLPNFDSNARYNYQVPLVNVIHQETLQSRFDQQLPRANQIYGNFAFLSMRADNTNVFGFLDKGKTTGINTGVNWMHSFNRRLYTIAGIQFSRFSTNTIPFFAYRKNVSGIAGISGNNQDPENWGPPSLLFSSGIAGLSDAQYSLNRNQTTGLTLQLSWNHRTHYLTMGGDFRRQQFNVLAQENPRGTFGFTGAAAGSDFAGFLLGIPNTSSIAYGNKDKYFRASMADAYILDDWRIHSSFTLNLGIRWEYGSPMAELYGRLVNLHIARGFTTATPVIGNSFLRPDRNNFAPRVGFAWRPFATSSMVVRGGYGIYYDTSNYQSIANQMAQQSPLSTNLRVENSTTNPLTLADGFKSSSSITPNTFAVDPNFRTGYSQNWQLSVQRDLPASLVMIASYLGIKGTRAQQQFLPNTFPIGASNPCFECPAGFTYVTANGNSNRHAAQVELRRRLRSGFTASVQYTFSKSIDNAASLGGQGSSSSTQTAQASGAQNSPSVAIATTPVASTAAIAQNWLDLHAERSLSSFDRRHVASVLLQYTTGIGIGGGWRGMLFKEWTFASQITAGTGLPLTPIYFAAVPGTGVTGSIRPNYTGAPLYDAPNGFFLNSAAYAQSAKGQWGNAGRHSITGPSQFILNASTGRTFRVGDWLNLEMRVDVTNALNHPVFPSWNTIVNSAQFGLPNPANPMRSIQMTARLGF